MLAGFDSLPAQLSMSRIRTDLDRGCQRRAQSPLAKESRRLFLAMAVAALAAISGCGAKSDRFEVSGTVTLDGQPLDDAAIRLTSLGVDKASAGAVIQGGEFRIPQDKGLRAGDYQVEINAPDNEGPPVMSPGPGGGIPTARERVPAEYNVNSEKTITVTADGDNHCVFDIVSSPK